MYLRLKEVFGYFERRIHEFEYFLNLQDYNFYKREDKDELVRNSFFTLNDFIVIPQIGRNEIVKQFLIEENNQALLRKQENMDESTAFQHFHWYLEDKHLNSEWNKFEEVMVIAFASKWCEENQINYTLK